MKDPRRIHLIGGNLSDMRIAAGISPVNPNFAQFDCDKLAPTTIAVGPSMTLTLQYKRSRVSCHLTLKHRAAPEVSPVLPPSLMRLIWG